MITEQEFLSHCHFIVEQAFELAELMDSVDRTKTGRMTFQNWQNDNPWDRYPDTRCEIIGPFREQKFCRHCFYNIESYPCPHCGGSKSAWSE